MFGTYDMLEVSTRLLLYTSSSTALMFLAIVDTTAANYVFVLIDVNMYNPATEQGLEGAQKMLLYSTALYCAVHFRFKVNSPSSIQQRR